MISKARIEAEESVTFMLGWLCSTEVFEEGGPHNIDVWWSYAGSPIVTTSVTISTMGRCHGFSVYPQPIVDYMGGMGGTPDPGIASIVTVRNLCMCTLSSLALLVN